MNETPNGLQQSSTKSLHVAIIGAGFSGTLVAIHLMRRSSSVQIELIDERLPGRGLAYSTDCDQHLLNVPAIRMSAFGDDPHHFVNWWQQRYGKSVAEASSFAPRKLYGSYIQDVLQTTARDSKPSVKLRHHVSSATNAHFDGLAVHVALQNGSRLRVDKAVLALGNAAPRDAFRPQPHYYSSPWQAGALADFAPESRVLLIGAGLTAVDTFLSLISNGHKGKIMMISRRGQIARTHESYRPLANSFPIEGQTSARHLLRSLRAATREAETNGRNWRAVVDSLRPVTNDLWQQFSEVERRRVFRHLKTWWDIHRHRMAPEIGARVEDALANERLIVHAGRVQQLAQQDRELTATIRLRDGSTLDVEVDRVINCTGPESEYRSAHSPLLDRLMAAGQIVPGSTGRGLRTNEKGELIGRDGRPIDWLTTLGPTRFGDLFETTAVPELRWQAEALANHILAVNREPVEVSPEMFMAAGI